MLRCTSAQGIGSLHRGWCGFPLPLLGIYTFFYVYVLLLNRSSEASWGRHEDLYLVQARCKEAFPSLEVRFLRILTIYHLSYYLPMAYVK